MQTKTTDTQDLWWCPKCNQMVPVVSIRMDVFGGNANQRVYHCPEGHEIVEAL